MKTTTQTAAEMNETLSDLTARMHTGEITEAQAFAEFVGRPMTEDDARGMATLHAESMARVAAMVAEDTPPSLAHPAPSGVHPEPDQMAREALPDLSPAERGWVAVGAALERARVIAWLRLDAAPSSICAKLADDLEGKAQP